MKSETVKLNGTPYLKIEVITVNQKGKVFFLGKILAIDFLKLYTVRPAKYDLSKHIALAKSFDDEKEYYNHLIRQDEKSISEKDFQREYDRARVNKITKFLDEEEYPFFPNTIIATCDLINDFKEFDLTEESNVDQFIALSGKPDHLSFLFKDEDKYSLLIPYNSNSILVIDGQHRLRGLEGVGDEIKEEYELLVSFIIGVDRSVIAQLFYTINYEQKSVNKSLLYHLTGEFSSELDELTFMHNVVKLLNELESSPFFGKIKMLGVNPKNATDDERAKLTISQAFLIDYLIKTISINSINSNLQPIFLYYYKNEKLQIEIIKFVIKYFNAVKSLKSLDWESPNNSILTKGVGIAALIRTLHFLFVKIFIDEWKMNPDKISETTEESLREKMEGLINVDFSREGEFGGTASGGSINKISSKIIEKLEYFGNMSYSSFLEHFKVNYLPEFKNWVRRFNK